MAATVTPNPNNLVQPIASKGLTLSPLANLIVYLISLKARSTMFVPVLAISAGNDTKFPKGNLRVPLTKSETKS